MHQESDLDWLHTELKKKYDLKMNKISGHRAHSQEGVFLGRAIRLSYEGIGIEGDKKHVDTLLKEWGMSEAKGVATPITNELSKRGNNRPEMKPMEAQRYRRAVARVNYMAQDRCDIGTASKIMSQTMAKPLQGDEGMVKRVIRYLIGHPRCVSLFLFQGPEQSMNIYADSDWAGDEETRKSTSGGFVRHGDHVLCHWSKIQATVALSSGEAEVNALVKGISEGISVRVVEKSRLREGH